MMLDELVIYANHEPIQAGFSVWLIAKSSEDPDHVGIVTNLTMENVHRAEATPQPTFVLKDEAARNLMDQLWNAGLRPTNYEDLRGEISAQREHIKDLRSLLSYLQSLVDTVLTRGNSVPTYRPPNK